MALELGLGILTKLNSQTERCTLIARFSIVLTILAISASGCRSVPTASDAESATNDPGSFFRDFDFEYPTSDANPFWIYSKSGQQPCVAGYDHSINTEDRTAGQQSLLLTYQGTGFCPGTSLYALTLLPARTFAGKHVTISADIKLMSDVTGFLGMFSQNGDGTSSNADTSESTDWTIRNWQRVSFDYVVPENVTSLMLSAALSAQSATGSSSAAAINGRVLFDNISVRIAEGGQEIRGSTDQNIMLPSQDHIGDLKDLAQGNVLEGPTITKISSDLSAATFVGLGEATHGTAEFQKQKVALIKTLVADFGFRAVGFEDDMSYARALDSYVQEGPVPTGGLAKSFYYRWWKTDEVIDLLNWLRTYNASHPSDPVHFYGFDIEGPTLVLNQLTKYLTNSTQSDRGQAQSLLQTYSQKFSSSDWAGAKDTALALVNWTKSHSSTPASDDESWAIQEAGLLVQVAVRKQSSSAARDAFMADNIDWISDHQQEAKVVIWAHNGHVQKTLGAMGGDLARRHGEKYRALGFAFNEGTFLRFNFNTNQLDNITFAPASKVSVDGVISRLGLDSVYLNPAALSSPKFNFMNGRPQRDSGAEGDDAYVVSMFPERFDALIYFAVSTPIVLQN